MASGFIGERSLLAALSLGEKAERGKGQPYCSSMLIEPWKI
jgi:hypothetical protein